MAWNWDEHPVLKIGGAIVGGVSVVVAVWVFFDSIRRDEIAIQKSLYSQIAVHTEIKEVLDEIQHTLQQMNQRIRNIDRTLDGTTEKVNQLRIEVAEVRTLMTARHIPLTPSTPQ